MGRKALTVIEIGDVMPTNKYGDVRVVEKRGQKFLVSFVDTGYETLVYRANLIAGKVKDYTKPHHALKGWEDCQEPGVSNSGHKFTIIKKNAKKCLVKFDETGYIRECFIDNVKAGKVSDPYSKSFLGIGYLGEYSKSKPYWKQAKQLWSNMMKRCYNPKDDKGYYGRCFVDDRWKCFANFLEDLPELEGFDDWLLGFEEGNTKYNLDKDLKIPGNDTYSREACMFLSEHTNKGATSQNNYGRD